VHFSQAGETLPVVLLFAAEFLFGGKLYAPVSFLRRNAVSVGAGASVAYIFIMLLPELENAGDVFRQSTSHMELLYQGKYGLNLAIMTGFLVFYGLEEIVAEKRSAESEPGTGLIFWTHMGGFGSYSGLVCYLLVRSLESGKSSLFIYVIAMGLHFLLCSQSLRAEHGAGYDRVGRWLLAACSVGGWLVGMLLDLPKPLVVILFGLVTGSVLANTMIMELPRDQKGKFIPFLAGAVAYAALLILFN